MRIVKSDRGQRGHRSASIERHRYPQLIDSGVWSRALAMVPDGYAAFLYARVSVPSPVELDLLRGPMPATSSPCAAALRATGAAS